MMPETDRWIVKYRRYPSDPWTEKPFASEGAANQFSANKYNYMQSAGEFEIAHFVDAAARSTLAQKVLAVVAAEHLEGYVEGEKIGYAVARGRKEDDIAYDNAVNHVLSALSELFQREGIEIERNPQ